MRCGSEPSRRIDPSGMLDARALCLSLLLKIGVALWWLRRTDEAIAAWRGGLDAKYTDAAGGVELPSLLLFASIRTADPALEKDAQGSAQEALAHKAGEKCLAWAGRRISARAYW